MPYHQQACHLTDALPEFQGLLCYHLISVIMFTHANRTILTVLSTCPAVALKVILRHVPYIFFPIPYCHILQDLRQFYSHPNVMLSSILDCINYYLWPFLAGSMHYSIASLIYLTVCCDMLYTTKSIFSTSI